MPSASAAATLSSWLDNESWQSWMISSASDILKLAQAEM